MQCRGSTWPFPNKKLWHQHGKHVDDDEINPAIVDNFLRLFGGQGQTLLDVGSGTGAGAVAAAYAGMSSVSVGHTNVAVVVAVGSSIIVVVIFQEYQYVLQLLL